MTEVTEGLMRDAIRKAFSVPDGSGSGLVDWDGMILDKLPGN